MVKVKLNIEKKWLIGFMVFKLERSLHTIYITSLKASLLNLFMSTYIISLVLSGVGRPIHPYVSVRHPSRHLAAVYLNILTIRNFFKTLKNRNKTKTYKINIFKHETRKGNTVK